MIRISKQQKYTREPGTVAHPCSSATQGRDGEVVGFKILIVSKASLDNTQQNPVLETNTPNPLTNTLVPKKLEVNVLSTLCPKLFLLEVFKGTCHTINYL